MLMTWFILVSRVAHTKATMITKAFHETRVAREIELPGVLGISRVAAAS
jgi:hypothetical protein